MEWNGVNPSEYSRHHHHLEVSYGGGEEVTFRSTLALTQSDVTNDGSSKATIGTGGFVCKATKCILDADISEMLTAFKFGYDYAETQSNNELTLFHSFTSELQELQIVNFGEYVSKFGYVSNRLEFDHKVYAQFIDVLKDHEFEIALTLLNNDQKFNFKMAGSNSLPTTYLPVRPGAIGPSGEFVIDLNKNNNRFVTYLDGQWIFKLFDRECSTQGAFFDLHFGDLSDGFRSFEKFQIILNSSDDNVDLNTVMNSKSAAPVAQIYYDISGHFTEAPATVGFQVNVADQSARGALTASAKHLTAYKPKATTWSIHEHIFHYSLRSEFSATSAEVPIDVTLEVFRNNMQQQVMVVTKLTFAEIIPAIGIHEPSEYILEMIVKITQPLYYFNLDLDNVGTLYTEFGYEAVGAIATHGKLLFDFHKVMGPSSAFLAEHRFDFSTGENGKTEVSLINTISQKSDGKAFDDSATLEIQCIHEIDQAIDFMIQFVVPRNKMNFITSVKGTGVFTAWTFDISSKFQGFNLGLDNDPSKSLYEELSIKWAPSSVGRSGEVKETGFLVQIEDFKLNFQPFWSLRSTEKVNFSGFLSVSNQWDGADDIHSVLQNAVYNSLPETELFFNGDRTPIDHHYSYKYTHTYNAVEKTLSMEIGGSANASHNEQDIFSATVVGLQLNAAARKSNVRFEFLGQPTGAEMYSANIGYEYNDPAILVIELGLDAVNKIDTKIGMSVEYENSPFVYTFLNMTQDVTDDNSVPSLLSIQNKVQVVDAELSTNWWRVVRNFNIVNRFSVDVAYPTGENELHTFYEPNMLVAITQEEFLYRLTMSHNCAWFAESGIPLGTSGFEFVTTINTDMVKYHDLIVQSSNTAENSFKRITMIIISPIVMPFMPLIRKDAPDTDRRKRSARQADYNTNFKVNVFLPDDEKSFTINQNYEIRKTLYLYELEYEADWPELEALSASNFELKNRLDEKRKELRVEARIDDQRYLIGGKFDIEYQNSDDRTAVQINELKLQQQVPLLDTLHIPNKVELTANCFIQKDANGAHASCDQTRLTFESQDESLEYTFSGEIRQENTDVTGDAEFTHLDDQRLLDLNVPQRVQLIINGVNSPATECKYPTANCLIGFDGQVEIKTAHDKFDALESAGTADVTIDLGQSENQLVTLFDFEITNAMGINSDEQFDGLDISIVHDATDQDPLLHFSIAVPENGETEVYALNATYGNSDGNARARATLDKVGSETYFHGMYDISIQKSAIR